MSSAMFGQIAVCPACKSKMRERRAGDVRVDRCDHCGGVWLDGGECERLIAAGQSAHTDAPSLSPTILQSTLVPGPARICPRDHQQLIHMSALGQPHIKYEKCQSCGGCFFDSQELRDLGEITLRERLNSWFGC